MSVKVIFEYDESAEKWSTSVEAASSIEEAKHAFNAVVLTCQIVDPELLCETEVTEGVGCVYKVRPAAPAYCPSCGYSQRECSLYGDHNLCPLYPFFSFEKK